jgi:hypothetical protein
MRMRDIKAFYYIADISNIESILRLGILSFNLAKNVPHKSIAMNEIQVRRGNVVIPDAGGRGKSLHDFVPLYFDSWNPMLSKLRDMNENICIIAIEKGIIDIPGVVVADRNASRDYCKFAPAPEGLGNVDFDVVFARSWISDDKIKEYDNKGKKCAEILVPKLVGSKYIKGGFVVNEKTAEKLDAEISRLKCNFKIIVNGNKFF